MRASLGGGAVMQAYSYQETDEWTGGIIFAKSPIDARRNAANYLNRDGIGGLKINRRKDLDRYEETGVPARVLVAEGWNFECNGCGMRVDEDNLLDIGLSHKHVVGNESGWVFCCHSCRADYLSEKAARDAYGEAFLDMLREMVCTRFPSVQHNFDKFQSHVYCQSDADQISVVQALVKFDFPGREYAPATLEYRHEGIHGPTLIGPVKPQFYCSNGDQEAFEAMATQSRRAA